MLAAGVGILAVACSTERAEDKIDALAEEFPGVSREAAPNVDEVPAGTEEATRDGAPSEEQAAIDDDSVGEHGAPPGREPRGRSDGEGDEAEGDEQPCQCVDKPLDPAACVDQASLEVDPGDAASG